MFPIFNTSTHIPLPHTQANHPLPGVNGQKGVARVCSASASSTITFEYRSWPDGSQPGSIDISHKGPCAVYMKKVDSAMADNNAVGPGWFKIFAEDYDAGAGKWCTEKVLANNGYLSVKLPSDIAGGYYLLRPELLALHQADKTPPDPQFYVGCAQLFLSSTGTVTPKDTVSIPGYVDMTKDHAAMTFNIWNQHMALPYPSIGPPVYSSSKTPKRSLQSRDMRQTQGLRPANCVLQNDNWCGIEVPSYNDETSCWAVRLPFFPLFPPLLSTLSAKPANTHLTPQTDKNCWDQTTTCYSSSGPTGSKNCHIWEAKCRTIQSGCKSGNFNGPPDAGKDLTPPLVKAVGLPPPMGMTGSAAPAPPPALSPEASPSPAPETSPAPMLQAGSGSGGSVDQCGPTNGGETCAAGLCCSSHG